MSLIKLQGNASGTGAFTIAAPNSNTDRTLTLPDATGTVNVSGLANEVPAGSAGAPAIYPTGDTNTGIFFPAADTIAFSEGGTEAMRIGSSGDVLIGVTSSNSRFVVQDINSGNTTNTVRVLSSGGTNEYFAIRSDGYLSASYTYSNLTSAAAANMVIGSGGFIYRSTSSLKYKKDVEDTAHGLSDVLNLRAVTYKGKSEGDGEKVFGGLIAEEVHAAGLSEFVLYNEDGEPDALHYGHMVSLAFKAIQEQQAQIEDLKAEVAALKGASA